MHRSTEYNDERLKGHTIIAESLGKLRLAVIRKSNMLLKLHHHSCILNVLFVLGRNTIQNNPTFNSEIRLNQHIKAIWNVTYLSSAKNNDMTSNW